MNDQRKTKAQLIQELNDLRHRLASVDGGDSPAEKAGPPSDPARGIGMRRQAEEQSDIFRTISDSAIYGLAIADMDGMITYVNDCFAAIHGYSVNEMIGKPFAICHTEEHLEKVMKVNQELLTTGKFEFQEIWHLHQDGAVFPTLMSGAIIKDDDGKPIYMVATTIDITERNQAKEALRASEERFRSIFEQAAVGIAHVALEGTFIHLNQRYCDITGYSHAELINMTFKQITHPDDLEADQAYVTQLLDGDIQTFSMEKRYIRPAGDIVWVTLTVSLVCSETNEPEYFIAVIEDITERKWAELKLKEERNKSLSIVSAMKFGLTIQDTDFNIIYQNQVVVDIFGNQLGKKCYRIYEGKEEICEGCPVKKAFADGQSHTVERKVVMPSGEIGYWENTANPIKDANGEIISCLEIANNITERKRAEEALKTSESMLQASQMIGRIGSFEMDLKSGNVKWSDQLFDLFGMKRTKEPIDYEKVLALIHPDDRERAIKVSGDAAKEGKPYELEHRVIHPDGKIVDLLIKGDVIRNEKNEIIKIGGTVQDITERKRAEEALVKARDELELRVIERTNELAEVNVKLQDDIAQRKQAESELEESREQLRSLSIHLQSLREESHKFVARELHEELAQSLAALKMDLLQLRGKLRVDQKHLQEEIASMSELAGSMLQRMTELSSQLRPAMLDDLGVVPTLKWEAKEFSNRTGIDCALTVGPEEIDLDPDRATAVYRIFKEALTNIARHAQATAVKVSLKLDSGQLVMEISDDGIGITDEQIASPQSFGLISIRERVIHWGGETMITGDIGKGTTIAVIIPLDDGASHDDLDSNSGGTLTGEDRPPGS